MEEAAELSNYLPLAFKGLKEQEYIEFLWNAFETSYTHGKYQFTFLVYVNFTTRWLPSTRLMTRTPTLDPNEPDAQEI